MLNQSNLLVEVPEALLDTGLTFSDGKPVSAITLKALLFIFFSFDGEYRREITIHITDLCGVLAHQYRGSSSNHVHHAHRIISHLESITGQPLKFRRYRGKSMHRMVCLESLDADVHKDLLAIKFSPEFIRYWKNGTYNYFQFVDLKYLFRLHTLSSVILYLFFTVHRFHSGTFTPGQLAKLLTGDSTYPYKLIKKDMLLPAIKLICAKTDFHVDFTEERSDNKIQKVHFSICNSPAEDEIKHYCAFHGISTDEYDPEQYNTDWQSEYNYDFISQEYTSNA
ncbi:replication initiation protein [Lacrimispora sp. 210928-DFI.3.58]|uniref:replication initiation protein n=1 Tax=Lacrimispora sp. 210928-DFI.3.58 TaxID=2883214 RepID=UPI001D08BD91|nr:replication initiation protein [Lacrimispora sp. 210928-DFI.3.58]MCB7320974.1 replication initiation protein [Lacrimispora sp. 210928-DFI.3.58]